VANGNCNARVGRGNEGLTVVSEILSRKAWALPTGGRKGDSQEVEKKRRKGESPLVKVRRISLLREGDEKGHITCVGEKKVTFRSARGEE